MEFFFKKLDFKLIYSEVTIISVVKELVIALINELNVVVELILAVILEVDVLLLDVLLDVILDELVVIRESMQAV